MSQLKPARTNNVRPGCYKKTTLTFLKTKYSLHLFPGLSAAAPEGAVSLPSVNVRHQFIRKAAVQL